VCVRVHECVCVCVCVCHFHCGTWSCVKMLNHLLHIFNTFNCTNQMCNVYLLHTFTVYLLYVTVSYSRSSGRTFVPFSSNSMFWCSYCSMDSIVVINNLLAVTQETVLNRPLGLYTAFTSTRPNPNIKKDRWTHTLTVIDDASRQKNNSQSHPTAKIILINGF